MPGEPTILFRSYDQSPLGQIGDAAYVYDSTGVPVPRVLGSYALIFVIDGQGVYADTNHKQVAVAAGDMLILFPDVAHRYGPSRRGKWSEFYILFHGPVFDMWRSTGILTPQRPVFRLGQVEPWLKRLTNVVDVTVTGPSERQIVMVSRLAVRHRRHYHISDNLPRIGFTGLANRSLPLAGERACRGD